MRRQNDLSPEENLMVEHCCTWCCLIERSKSGCSAPYMPPNYSVSEKAPQQLLLIRPNRWGLRLIFDPSLTEHFIYPAFPASLVKGADRGWSNTRHMTGEGKNLASAYYWLPSLIFHQRLEHLHAAGSTNSPDFLPLKTCSQNDQY